MNVELFLKTLPIMAKGMAGIFIVTAVIMLFILILNNSNRIGSFFTKGFKKLFTKKTK
ncbi:MAG: hypothetical protein RR054_05245 [Clostridia bacterium]